MRATFKKRLKIDEKRTGHLRVIFDHTFRCDVTAWFEETESNPFGWVMQFESKNDALLKQFKSSIFKQAVEYLEAHTGSKVTEINFEKLQDLANTTEIKTFGKN